MTERDIFIAALQKDDLAQRQAYLDEACAGQPELRRQVDDLLRLYEGAGSFLQKPAAESPATGAPGDIPDSMLSPEASGTSIGPYKLIQLLGEGGMGAVWMAQQTEPVKRLVAVKIIKPGMDSRQVIARFEAERQALALMDHPNIAKVFDAGTTPAGRPYFAMELVKGAQVTRFCDERRLTPRQRLELFVPVCHAVQHAHQKGIIHRDLKPSNVLIALYDGKPVPKVIDFGVAKATGQQLTEKTLVTGFGAVVGTLEYMSPEQAEINQLDIDTRSDIYSLGVLLYELLAGSPPFTRWELEKAGMWEMLRVIREQEPSKPSTKLSTAEGLPTLAANRGTEPAKLTKLVRGELDWIVMKALEKDRNRRYETANGFAMDVQRYLADEPVQAGPPSAGYRLRKFVRRNKRQVLAAGLVLAALLVAIVGTTIGYVRARQAAQQARLANEESAARLVQIEKINNTLFDIFTEFDIRKVKAGPDPVEYVLAQRLIEAGRKLDAKAIHDPRVLANLQNRLGHTLASLGRHQEAIEFLTLARDTRQADLGAEHPDTLVSMNNLAEGYRAAGKLDLALPLLEETLKLRKVKPGADHPSTLNSMNNLAEGYRDAGKLDLALPLLEETLKLRKAKLGADHPSTLNSMSNLAEGYRDVGKLDLALPLWEESLKLRKAKLGTDHPDTLMTMSNLARGYRVAGKLDLALPLLEETLKLRQAVLGADHPDTLVSRNNLALGYKAAGKLELALRLYDETLKLMRTKLGPDHPNTLVTMNNLAKGYRDAEKLDLALPLLEETLKLRQAKRGADHPDTLVSMSNLAEGYQAAGKLDLALPMFQKAARGMEARHFKHEYAGPIVSKLIDCHEKLKQFDQAEPWRRKWLEAVKMRAGAGSISYAGELAGLGLNLLQQKKATEAEPMLRESLAIRENKEPDAWTTFNTKWGLGAALAAQKRYADGEPLLLAGYMGMKQREAKMPPKEAAQRLREAVEKLVQLYDDWGRPEKAAEWRKKLTDQQK